MLMSPLNGVNKELTGRVSLCAARAGGVMAAVSVCNYTLSRCILAAVVGEQAAQPRTRQGGGRKERGCMEIPAPPLLSPCSSDSSSLCPCSGCAGLSSGQEEGWLWLLWGRAAPSPILSPPLSPSVALELAWWQHAQGGTAKTCWTQVRGAAPLKAMGRYKVCPRQPPGCPGRRSCCFEESLCGQALCMLIWDSAPRPQ